MSIGTITTHSFCVVKDGKALEGTKEDIVLQACVFGFVDGKLTAKFHGYPSVSYHSYSEQYTEEERHRDAVKFLFFNLPQFGYCMYRDVGF